jgi:hypothetical protein
MSASFSCPVSPLRLAALLARDQPPSRTRDNILRIVEKIKEIDPDAYRPGPCRVILPAAKL